MISLTQTWKELKLPLFISSLHIFEIRTSHLWKTVYFSIICRQMCDLNCIGEFVKNNLDTSSRFLLLWSRVPLLLGIQITALVWTGAAVTSLTCSLPLLPRSSLPAFRCPLVRKPSSCCWAATKPHESPSGKAERNLCDASLLCISNLLTSSSIVFQYLLEVFKPVHKAAFVLRV